MTILQGPLLQIQDSLTIFMTGKKIQDILARIVLQDIGQFYKIDDSLTRYTAVLQDVGESYKVQDSPTRYSTILQSIGRLVGKVTTTQKVQ